MDKYFVGEWFSDSAIMLSILNELVLVTGNDRQSNKFFLKKGKAQSAKVGTTWRKLIGKKEREKDDKTGLYKTKLLQEHPELMDIFNEYRNMYFPVFEFDQVTINYSPKGTIIKQHKDKVNVGDSILVAYGNYTGGQTYVENEKDRNFTLTDCRNELLCFNGAEKKHGVTAVTTGERYSLVFYKNKYKINSKN
tara:strand:+ start:477 stop:1055 length:579 start_codon:yes stop_codon:yes gene_type:complete